MLKYAYWVQVHDLWCWDQRHPRKWSNALTVESAGCRISMRTNMNVSFKKFFFPKCWRNAYPSPCGMNTEWTAGQKEAIGLMRVMQSKCFLQLEFNLFINWKSVTRSYSRNISKKPQSFDQSEWLLSGPYSTVPSQWGAVFFIRSHTEPRVS